MGEIAEAMLDGELCEGCGVYMGDACGYPRRCSGCRPSKAERKAANIARHEAEQARQKKAPCPTCGKRVRLVGMADHQRDAHDAGRTAAEADAQSQKHVGRRPADDDAECWPDNHGPLSNLPHDA